MVGWQVLSRPSAAEGGGRRPAFTGLATQPYLATEVDGWQHKLSRVSQNRAAVQEIAPPLNGSAKWATGVAATNANLADIAAMYARLELVSRYTNGDSSFVTGIGRWVCAVAETAVTVHASTSAGMVLLMAIRSRVLAL